MLAWSDWQDPMDKETTMDTNRLQIPGRLGRWGLGAALFAALAMMGCEGTMPQLGGAKTPVTGAAGPP